MGPVATKMVKKFESLGKTQARILMVGLDAAGKTTILYKLKLNETISTIPTIGFNVETVEPVKGVQFTVWDIGGQDKIRRLWSYYFQNTQGLVFVVDSNDRDRLEEAKHELAAVLAEKDMVGVPLLILANKQDLPEAMSAAQIVQGLDLQNVSNRWFVQTTCATTGAGLYEAMDKLAHFVKEIRQEQKERTKKMKKESKR